MRDRCDVIGYVGCPGTNSGCSADRSCHIGQRIDGNIEHCGCSRVTAVSIGVGDTDGLRTGSDPGDRYVVGAGSIVDHTAKGNGPVVIGHAGLSSIIIVPGIDAEAGCPVNGGNRRWIYGDGKR